MTVSTLLTLNITYAYCHHSIISSTCGGDGPLAKFTGPAAGANGPQQVHPVAGPAALVDHQH